MKNQPSAVDPNDPRFHANALLHLAKEFLSKDQGGEAEVCIDVAYKLFAEHGRLPRDAQFSQAMLDNVLTTLRQMIRKVWAERTAARTTTPETKN